MSIQMGGFNLEITNQNQEQIESDMNFQPKCLVISEGTESIPTFSCSFDSQSMFYAMNFESGEISLSGNGIESRVYEVTATSFSPSNISGVLISPESYYIRDSNPLASNLSDAIKSLQIRDEIEGCDETDSENTFYQYNETPLECATRLLNMTGQNKTWAILDNRILVFDKEPKQSNSEFSMGENAVFSFSKARIDESNFTELKGDTERFNINFGRYNVCRPRLSRYPRECIASVVQKRRDSKGYNCMAFKSYNSNPGLNIGDSVKVEDWSEGVQDFIVTAITIKIYKSNCNWDVTFASPQGWGTDD